MGVEVFCNDILLQVSPLEDTFLSSIAIELIIARSTVEKEVQHAGVDKGSFRDLGSA